MQFFRHEKFRVPG